LYTFVPRPVRISFDDENNRIIVLTLVDNAPILVFNLSTEIIDTIKNTNINDPDAICKDLNNNYYITSFADNIVFKFNNDFSSEPEIISTGHSQPSGIGYNAIENKLAVTNYNANRIDYIQLALTNIVFDRHCNNKEYS